MNPAKVFSKSGKSRQSVRSTYEEVTSDHLHDSLPIDSTTTFGIQNESRHFEWRDSSMSHATPFCVTDFLVKISKSDFLIFYYFSITKNK
jgi:hypothetical protein